TPCASSFVARVGGARRMFQFLFTLLFLATGGRAQTISPPDRPSDAQEISQANNTPAAPVQGPATQSVTPQAVRVTCSSTGGAREHCPADTSSGAVLARSFGDAACLLGKTWGYDDTGIWVSDGCSAEFVVAGGTLPPESKEPKKTKPLEHIPNVG